MSLEFGVAVIVTASIVLGGLFGYMLGEQDGAIAAHKGEIVCIQIPYREPRWECGEP